MNIKGDYSGLTSYSVGDVVRLEGVIYNLVRPCAAGTTPTNTLYWERMPQPLADAAELMMDSIQVAESGALTGKVANNLTTTAAGKVLDARQGKALKDLINGVGAELDLVYPDSKTLVLASSTASSEKKFAITVDDDGELTATEITEAT
jgi:hypothetical protein